MALPAHLSLAYRRSAYTVAGLKLSLGRSSHALDGLLAGLGTSQAVLITAWNPASRRKPPGWNTCRMAELRARLGTATALPATGALHRWAEDHLLVAGDPRRLAVLARRFGQSAMVTLKRGRGPRLLSLV